MNRLVLALVAATLALPALAQHPHPPAPAARLAQAPAADLADGEIRKVDKANGKLTIRHGEIRSINMAPMTMVFGVKSPALLEGLAAGDKVKFTVEEVKGDYVVTSIRKAK
jgi:Cu/Ag efflux protein CusF